MDLSKKYLEWGKDNFRANGVDPDDHDFIFGDAFEWLGYLQRKVRAVSAPRSLNHACCHPCYVH